MNRATTDHIIAAVCDAFNMGSERLGYGAQAKAWLPVTIEDIMQDCRQGCPRPVNHCRDLCIYVILQHALVPDDFSDRYRRMTLERVGAIFGRSRHSVHRTMRLTCRLLQRPPYGHIYRDALAILAHANLKLWALPRYLDCDGA